MGKKINYSIEFYRIMFAINFVAVHVWMVYAIVTTGEMAHIWALDTILPFMIFSGYFLMHDFKRQQQRSSEEGVTAGRQAGTYLKSRIIRLLPVFLVAQLGGFVINSLYVTKVPVYLWPVALLNHICELVGLQLTGIGLGNGFIGVWGTPGINAKVLNAPLWFISGIIVVGFFVYFLLAKWEKVYLNFVGPLFALVYYGSQYLQDSNPVWYNMQHIGDFTFSEGFPHMFIGLTIGCLLWKAVNKLKDKEWSRGMRVFMTAASAILGIVIIYKTWVPLTLPFWGVILYINWGSVHVISIIFSFFVLLNADGFTKLFDKKIFKVPGRLALYIYMFHYPIIVLMGNLLNVHGEVNGMRMLYVVATVVSIVVGYAFMKLNDKVIQPWLQTKPWFSKRQRELEAEQSVS
jgi:peptidoglycan/LPS O-acetylase OafA/YrhL